MTPAEAAFLDRLKAKALRESPSIGRRLLEAWDIIKSTLNEREIADLIRSGRMEQILFGMLDDDTLDRAFLPARNEIDRYTVRLADSVTLPKRFGGVFDRLNPRVTEAARTLSTRVVDTLKGELRDSLRQRVRHGIEEGHGPIKIARDLRPVVGLAPSQEEAVRNFEFMLRTGDREALTRTLRDRRFDKTLRKALGKGGTGLSDDRIRTMVDAYRRRFIAHNAKTHARSAALDANRVAQRLSWEDAVARGVIDRSQLRKRRITAGDKRVRDEHRRIAAESRAGIPFDAPYSNGEVVSGELSFNCRCVDSIFVVAAEVAVAA